MHREHRGCFRAIVLAGFFCLANSTPRLFAADAAARHAEADALLTPENYDKISNGMTADDVKVILGKPPMGAGTKGDWTNTWLLSSDKKQAIKVHFKDGVVDRKSNTMQWGHSGERPTSTAPPGDSKTRSRRGDAADQSPDDKLTSLLRAAYVGDAHKRAAALRSIEKLPVDESRAPEVVAKLLPLLRGKDLGITSDAKGVLQKWITKDTDDALLNLLDKKPRTTDPTDPERDRLQFAISVLAKLKDPRAVEPLCKILHWSFFDCNAAADGLKSMGPEVAQAEVLKHLDDPDTNLQQKVREILDEWKKAGGGRDAGKSTAAEFDQLLADLKSAKPETRYHAANKLAQMPVDSARRREVAAQLAAMLDDHPSSVNQDIKTSQNKTQQNGLGALLGELVKHPANAALSALIVWGGAENEDAVLSLLKERNSPEDMKVGALRALAAWGTSKSLPTLQPLAKNSGSPLASPAQAAAKAIGERAKK